MSFSCLSPRDPPTTRPCVPRRSPACQHGSHKPGEPVTQRTEEPLVPSAGARQHAQGAARGDQAAAATLHRYGGGGTQQPSGTGAGRGFIIIAVFSLTFNSCRACAVGTVPNVPRFPALIRTTCHQSHGAIISAAPQRRKRRPRQHSNFPGCPLPAFRSCFAPSAGDLRELPRVPLRGEGSCGGGGAPRDSAASTRDEALFH